MIVFCLDIPYRNAKIGKQYTVFTITNITVSKEYNVNVRYNVNVTAILGNIVTSNKRAPDNTRS